MCRSVHWLTFPSYDADELRTRFSVALSDMYRAEVPLYGTLVDIVRHVDYSVLRKQGRSPESLPVRHQLERHGAIRLGTEHELRMIKRLFAVLGMHPMGYYDLTIVGFPLHATAFRPLSEESLARNPFRVFTSVLRRDLLSPSIRAVAESILAKRKLFTSRLLKIIDRVEAQRILSAQDADDLIEDALKIFKWHSRAIVSSDDYLAVKKEHPMVADIVCFPSAHINHLTPRTLDIDLVQKQMLSQGLPAKEKIEGPPRRECPILLRQTSFKALEEPVVFERAEGSSVSGTHTARFGEVEQRGAAVTRKGRELYDKLLSVATENATTAGDASQCEEILAQTFVLAFPDSWDELRAQGLVYFRYGPIPSYLQSTDNTPSSKLDSKVSIDQLISHGAIRYEPIVYEDFLPFSAAGIFKSNLKGEPEQQPLSDIRSGGKLDFESALGCHALDEFELYDTMQRDSLQHCAKALGVERIVLG